MKGHGHYSAVSALSEYNNLFTTHDNIIEEKFGGYSQGMREISKARNMLIKDCQEKFRNAEIQAERDSIKVIDSYTSQWKKMQLKIEEKLTGPNKSDVEIMEEERQIKEKIEIVKCDLLDIELKMQDALKGAYVTFASQLTKYVQDMVEKTSVFLGEECLGECQEFASKLR